MDQKSCRNSRAAESNVGPQLHISFEAFAGDLRRRGYHPNTIGLYGRVVAHFGRWLSPQHVTPRQIRPPHVDRFLQQHLPRCHCPQPVVRSLPVCRGALHGFLDFLRRERWIPVPRKRVPRLRAADRLLLEFDQHLDHVQGLSVVTRRARRRYALCFSELALRANEVAALTLDDVDWRALTVRLRQTKQRRERLLPLPSRVARALVAYLQRSRPAVGHRLLFINLRPPLGRPLPTDGVRNVIRRAFGRCGIKPTGPHILRQSWATAAHQRGTDLKRIADVLGHRSVDTTAPYAKVHFEQLRQAALPWPCLQP